MSQFFDTFLKDLYPTPYEIPGSITIDPTDILTSFSTKIHMTGDVVADGNSSNFASRIAPTGVIAGTYTKVRVNAKGQVIEGLTSSTDTLTNLRWANVTEKPTSLAGYGITDVYNKAEVDIKIADAVEYIQQPLIIRNFTFPQSQVWKVKHNLMTLNFVETITNGDGQRIYANIKVVDNTEFWIEFTSPEQGRVNVMFCMDI